MRIRQKSLGDSNIVGEKIVARRNELGMKQKELLVQLQINGIDLTSSGLSKIEGQFRTVSDYELKEIAKILDVSVDWLLDIK